MKTSAKILFASFLMFVVSTTNANNGAKSTKSEAPAESSVVLAQCLPTSQGVSYLQNCSHHHTVYSIEVIPGTCNFRAIIENCKTATVYVSNGIIVQHTDVAGNCEDQ